MTTQDPAPVLKVCPFCEAPASESLRWRGHFGCSDWKCGAYGINLPAERWNRRPPLPAPVLDEAMEAAKVLFAAYILGVQRNEPWVKGDWHALSERSRAVWLERADQIRALLSRSPLPERDAVLEVAARSLEAEADSFDARDDADYAAAYRQCAKHVRALKAEGVEASPGAEGGGRNELAQPMTDSRSPASERSAK